MAAPPRSATITGHAGRWRIRWPVVIAIALLGAALGALASLAVPATYSSESTVLVNPMTSSSTTEDAGSVPPLSMPTEQQVVTSSTVAEAAAALLAPRYALTSEQVRDAVTATVPDDSLTVRIRFTGDTPEQASAGADAVGEAYLTKRRTNAADRANRLANAATRKIAELEIQLAQPQNASTTQRRSIQIQVAALADQLGRLDTDDTRPGQIIGRAEVPTAPTVSTALLLGAAGGLLGLLVGLPIALSRVKEDPSIRDVGGLAFLGDRAVVDGTHDSTRADTWDLAALMLNVPSDLRSDAFIVMVDAVRDPRNVVLPGQELVDALERQGHTAHVVDAGAVNQGKISRGWPTDRKRTSWAGGVVVLDTTGLESDATKIALATRSDTVVLARSTVDDSAALHRLTNLLRSKNVDIGVSALFRPPQASRRTKAQ